MVLLRLSQGFYFLLFFVMERCLAVINHAIFQEDEVACKGVIGRKHPLLLEGNYVISEYPHEASGTQALLYLQGLASC